MTSYAQQVHWTGSTGLYWPSWHSDGCLNTCMRAFTSAQLHLKFSILGRIAWANMMPPCRPEEHAVTLLATHPQLGKFKF